MITTGLEQLLDQPVATDDEGVDSIEGLRVDLFDFRACGLRSELVDPQNL